jgi:23S rRNA (guanosine2251-2'-O)-methyltransferase
VVAILWNIRSVYNVGSIFRTADAAGVEQLYLAGLTPTPLDRLGKVRPDMHKVSLGAEASVPWKKCGARTPDMRRLIAQLKQAGYAVFALEDAPEAKPLYLARVLKTCREPVAAGRLCLILGNEVRGVPPSVLKMADQVFKIPMQGKKESLNVSVAFGVAAFWFRLAHHHG